MDERDTVAEAMSICLTKILAIGSEKEVKAKTNDFVKISSKNYELLEIDLRGACIVPGFIDAHMHPVLSVYYKTQLKLSNIKSYSQLGQVLREETKKRSEDEWIIGFDLMENRFINPNEHFFPDKFKLDELSSNIPLIVFRYDGHICSVNSLALEKMGINKSSVKEIIPTSGEIRVDKNGHPTGVFTEGATTFAIEKAALPSQERLREAGILFTKELSSFGITTCGAIVQLEEIGIAGKMGSVEYPFIKYFLKEKIIEQDIVLHLLIRLKIILV
jgi:predicted amidohydrolase YtcJ